VSFAAQSGLRAGGRAVKKKRFSVEQITSVLQQVAEGIAVGEVCRQVGISEQTFYRWKKDYGGMLPSEAREKSAAGGEREAQVSGGRSLARQGHAAGCRSKKF
jgi:transposase-like protein